MQIAATVLSVLWFVTAVVLRVGIQRRRTGDSGIRATLGPRGSAEWWAGVLVGAGAVLVVAAPPLALAGVVDPPPAPTGLAAAGLVLAAAGVVATFAAQLGMGDSWRIGVDRGERTALVTGGPFGLVRNPIFTAMVATALGLTLLVPTVVGAAGLAATVVGVEVQVRLVEEPHLRATHGPAYVAYARSVGRFVPGVGRGA